MTKRKNRRVQRGGAPAETNDKIPVNAESGGPSEDAQLAQLEEQVRQDRSLELPLNYQSNFPLFKDYGMKPSHDKFLKLRNRAY